MKVEERSVHHKKYDGCYIKQWIRIPKSTWTSPILGKRSTCRTSSSMACLMRCEWWDVKWNPKEFNTFWWGDKMGQGVEKVKWQAKMWPCYTFLKLDKKFIYCTKFGL
jgi:hypothetical protein